LKLPTVLRVDGFEVRIYTDDHEPAHVHVFRAEGRARIRLPTGSAGAVVTEARMRTADLRRAVAIVNEYADLLRFEWRRFHG
jgi:hypothetical protein